MRNAFDQSNWMKHLTVVAVVVAALASGFAQAGDKEDPVPTSPAITGSTATLGETTIETSDLAGSDVDAKSALDVDMLIEAVLGEGLSQ